MNSMCSMTVQFKLLNLCLIAVVLGIAGAAIANDSDRKTVTLVDAGGIANSGSNIKSQVIEECILTLPKASDLAPVVDAKSKHMKGIDGDKAANASVRAYSAVVDVPYMVKQKQVVIVTTSSVEGMEPLVKEVDGRFDRTVRFESNSANGDRFFGRELAKEYYFSTKQGAIDDAMMRAKAWLKQNKTVMCSN